MDHDAHFNPHTWQTSPSDRPSLEIYAHRNQTWYSRITCPNKIQPSLNPKEPLMQTEQQFINNKFTQKIWRFGVIWKMNKHHLEHFVNKITPIKEQKNPMACTFSVVKNSTWFTTNSNRLLLLTTKQSQNKKIKNKKLAIDRKKNENTHIKMEIIQWRIRKKTKSVFASFINLMEKRNTISTLSPPPMRRWITQGHCRLGWTGPGQKVIEISLAKVRTAKLFW